MMRKLCSPVSISNECWPTLVSYPSVFKKTTGLYGVNLKLQRHMGNGPLRAQAEGAMECECMTDTPALTSGVPA